MDREEIFERVKTRLGQLLRDIRPEQLTPDARLVEDLGVDSMFLLESAMALEEEFGIEVEDEAAAKFETLGSVTDYIVAKLAAA